MITSIARRAQPPQEQPTETINELIATQDDEDDDDLSETHAPLKRGRGRPLGGKNKPRVKKEWDELA